MQIAPYGTWSSPVSADSVAEADTRRAFPTIAGDATYWVELRSRERGRSVLVRRAAAGEVEELLPPPWSVRTQVHEYGGRCYAVHGSTVYFVNFADQRIYRLEADAEPVPLTPEPPAPRAWRYADLVVTPDGAQLICVRERHEEGEVTNDLAVLPTDGSQPPAQLTGGHDFFHSPRLDPSGRRLAWVAWDLPRMPWDGTLLYEASLGEEGSVTDERIVAGGPSESVLEPLYGPDGRLHYVSDRTGWWNLYADDGGAGAALVTEEAEHTSPPWQFGMQGYGFLGDGSLVVRRRSSGRDRVGLCTPGSAEFEDLDLPFTWVSALVAGGDRVVVLAAAGSLGLRVASVALPSGAITVLSTARDGFDPRYLSEARPIAPELEGGGTTHALYYPPHNDDFEAPAGELPPLVVMSHGGPTSCASPALDDEVQYWTSRGFAVVDVDYGGSTGYGRAYRERLVGQWGVVDLGDCTRAALWLAEQGLADRSRLVVRGRSAGGYTTLCALTFGDEFAAGASWFGVADAGALARDTHKFESRYLDSLIGPWPEAEALYEQRSPIFHTDRMRTPVILLQGLEDRVVPPAQAEAMAAVLRERGVPFAHVAFEGEDHGFRQAPNIVQALESELAFYGAVLGFEPAGDLPPLEIENASALPGVRPT